MTRINNTLQESENRVRYTMNGFVIAVGSYIPDLMNEALKIGKSIGKVSVNVGGTACRVPASSAYIQKVAKLSRTGKKRKMARC